MNLSQTESYRNAATLKRSAAEQTPLPRVRERHLRSAEAWDAMASQGELTERLAQANSENRIKQPYQRRPSTENTLISSGSLTEQTAVPVTAEGTTSGGRLTAP